MRSACATSHPIASTHRHRVIFECARDVAGSHELTWVRYTLLPIQTSFRHIFMFRRTRSALGMESPQLSHRTIVRSLSLSLPAESYHTKSL